MVNKRENPYLKYLAIAGIVGIAFMFHLHLVGGINIQILNPIDIPVNTDLGNLKPIDVPVDIKIYQSIDQPRLSDIKKISGLNDLKLYDINITPQMGKVLTGQAAGKTPEAATITFLKSNMESPSKAVQTVKNVEGIEVRTIDWDKLEEGLKNVTDPRYTKYHPQTGRPYFDQRPIDLHLAKARVEEANLLADKLAQIFVQNGVEPDTTIAVIGGSVREGRVVPASDVDLLIKTDYKNGSRIFRLLKDESIRRNIADLAGSARQVDIIVFAPEAGGGIVKASSSPGVRFIIDKK